MCVVREVLPDGAEEESGKAAVSTAADDHRLAVVDTPMSTSAACPLTSRASTLTVGYLLDQPAKTMFRGGVGGA